MTYFLKFEPFADLLLALAVRCAYSGWFEEEKEEWKYSAALSFFVSLNCTNFMNKPKLTN